MSSDNMLLRMRDNMGSFVFDKDIFQKKFIMGSNFKNRAKSTAPDCDSVCPNNSDNGNTYKGYLSQELLSDTIHYLKGEVVTDKKVDNLEDKLEAEIEKQVSFENDELQGVFKDVITSFYFEKNENNDRGSVSLLRYQPASKAKDFGKFIADVFLEEETKEKFLDVFDNDKNPLDEIVSKSYLSLQILKTLKNDKEYARIFSDDLDSLFSVMNKDFRAALDGRNDIVGDMEFLLTYYLFIYLSQIALRLDNDLDGREKDEGIVFFKSAKEPVSEDRDCVIQGWKKVERKTSKVFKHLIVLNMLNCHDNKTPYLTYSEIYKEYESNVDERYEMNAALDYIIEQYTKVYIHDTDTPGICVDFSSIDKPENDMSVDSFKKKVQYIFNCVSYQLDSKNYRQNVVSYVASNYNHILKMRFVKSWGQLGHMLIINNEDLIRMIQICQRSSDRMDEERGIQISDLFAEFARRRLYLDGKTKQYIIDYLVDINLIDSKCDSEEAQYVKRIQ